MELFKKPNGRRIMIGNAFKIGAGAMLLSSPLYGAEGIPHITRIYTVRDIIDLILKQIPGAPFAQTVDTLKSGDAGNRVSGIVTTMFATVDIIEKAVAIKADFIISHEPTFYNHTDDPKWAGNNKVVEKKQALLKKHGVTVWRFHDYWHSHRPDGVFYGVTKKMGWDKLTVSERTITIQKISLQQLVDDLKKKLSIRHVRVIGDLSMSCSRIALIPGAAGGQTQMRVTEQAQPDVLIVGELHEWETAEYIRDARALGEQKALIILGHPVSEEPGMEWLVEWLQPRLEGVKVTHIPTTDPFTWL